MTSAAFHFESGASLAKYAATTSEAIDLVLDSVDGVRTVVWSVEATCEDSAGEWTITNPTSITGAVLNAPASGSGKACIVRCVVNGGSETDPRTGRQVAGDLAKRAKAYITPEVAAVGEVNESDPTFGWVPLVNGAIRGGGGGGSGTVTPDADELVLRDGFGAAYATSFVGPAGAAAALTAQGANAVSITSGAAVNVYGGASADINLDSARDVILDVGSTSDEIAIKAGGTTKLTVTPGATMTTILAPPSQAIELSADANSKLTLSGNTATVYGADRVALDGDTDVTITANAVTATCSDSSGTFLCEANAPMRIQPAQAVSGAGRRVMVASGDGQTPGTHLAGGIVFQVGAPVAGVTDEVEFQRRDGTKLLGVKQGGTGNTYIDTGANAMRLITTDAITLLATIAVLLRAGDIRLVDPNTAAQCHFLKSTSPSAQTSSATTIDIGSQAVGADGDYVLAEARIGWVNKTATRGGFRIVRQAFRRAGGSLTPIKSPIEYEPDAFVEAGETGVLVTVTSTSNFVVWRVTSPDTDLRRYTCNMTLDVRSTF